MPRLALVALALMALAAVACNGDDSSPTGGSPSPHTSPEPSPGTVTPDVTADAGETPAQAVATYIDTVGLDGQQLDLSRMADCPKDAVQTVVAETPTVVSRIALAQFCLALKNWEPDKAVTIIVDLPDSGESWEMRLEFDSDVSLWKIEDVKKVSG